MENIYCEISEQIKAELIQVNKHIAINIDLNSAIKNDIENYLNSPSKRIRTIIPILYFKSNNINLTESHYKLLASIELIHNASLMHDDVIDNGKIRRNIETLNAKYDNKLAVISGDYVISLALKNLLEIEIPEIISVFTDTLKTMCTGEINQYFNKFKKTRIEEYIEKSKQKTASLFECALKSCFIISKIQYTNFANEFINNFGIAFQIKDDLMNVLNRDKQKDSIDVKEGVYTAPYLLSEDYNDGIEKTKMLLNNYINCAINSLGNIPTNDYKNLLIRLTEQLKNV